MKKQIVTLMTLLGISVALIGCNTTEQKPDIDTVVETPVNEETSDSLPETEDSTKTEETASDASENTEDNKETTTDEKAVPEKENTDEVHDKTESKPNTDSTGTTTKPNTNDTSSKPGSNSNTNNKPATPAKPQPSPSAKPEASPSPSPTPEVKPEPTPENKPDTTSLSSSEVFAKITADIELPAQMDVDATLLNDLYGIDASLLEDYCVKMPMLSFSITEIGVFKVKDANNVSSIVDAINQRANNVGQMLYPSLQGTFDSRVITTKGNYILFAMDESSSVIETNFNNLIK